MIIVLSPNWKQPKIHMVPNTHSWATAVMVNALQGAEKIHTAKRLERNSFYDSERSTYVKSLIPDCKHAHVRTQTQRQRRRTHAQ